MPHRADSCRAITANGSNLSAFRHVTLYFVTLRLMQIRFVILAGMMSAAALSCAQAMLSAAEDQACYAGTSCQRTQIAAGSGMRSCISASSDDETDILAGDGILFRSSSHNFAVTSTNESVVRPADISMTHTATDGLYVLHVRPHAQGCTVLKVESVDESSHSPVYYIDYAATAGSHHALQTRWHTHHADISAAVCPDETHLLALDGQDNTISIYSTHQSGAPMSTSDNVSRSAVNGLPADIRVCAMCTSSEAYASGRRVYLLGSLSNGEDGATAEQNNRVLALNTTDTAQNMRFSLRSYSALLRPALIACGDRYGWDFTASAADGQKPTSADGLCAGGLTITPQGNEAYIALSSPRVPKVGESPNPANRRYAVLMPVTNFEAAMDPTGRSKTEPQVGMPVLFDLDQRTICNISHTGSGWYVLLAKNPDSNDDFALYLWNGERNPDASPVSVISGQVTRLPIDLTDITTTGCRPAAVMAQQYGSQIVIRMVSNSRDADLYDTQQTQQQIAADASRLPWVKFRSDLYAAGLPGRESVGRPSVSPRVEHCADGIIIRNTLPGHEVRVYNRAGQLVRQCSTGEPETRVELSKNDVFIVETEGLCLKIAR